MALMVLIIIDLRGFTNGTSFSTYMPVGMGVIQAQQQNAAGKYNQAIQNRNAQIADQEAQQIEKQKRI